MRKLLFIMVIHVEYPTMQCCNFLFSGKILNNTPYFRKSTVHGYLDVRVEIFLTSTRT